MKRRTSTPVTLTITTGANADATLFLPQSWFAGNAEVADRLLVTPTPDQKRRTVLTTSISNADGEVAGVTARTFHALGGRGQDQLSCNTRPARWWDVLRYVSGAALAVAVAVLSAASAGFAAWFGLQDGLSKISGDHAAFVVVAAAFLVNALLAVLTLRQSLRAI